MKSWHQTAKLEILSSIGNTWKWRPPGLEAYCSVPCESDCVIGDQIGKMGEESDLNLILSPPSPPPHLGLALGLSSRAPFPYSDSNSHTAMANPIWFQPLIPYTEPQFIPVNGAATAASEEEDHSYLASRGGSSGSHRLRRHSRHIRMPFSEETIKEEKEKEATVEKREMAEKQAEAANSAANFECNICLDVACEPVVTLCGHLFCWPCIHQWLHCYSVSKECPVCKGEVTDKNIIPIYGRGVNGQISKNPNPNEDALPPRPHARRVESWRQRESERGGVLLPLSRRLEELIRLRNNRRGRLERSNDNGNPRQNESIHDLVMAATDRIVTRLRAVRRLQNEEGFDETWAFRERILGRRYRHQIESRTAHPESSEVTHATTSHPPSSGVIDSTADNVGGPRSQNSTMEGLNSSLRRADRLAIRTRLASMEGMLPTLASINIRTPRPPALNSNSSEPLGSAAALARSGSGVGMTRRPAFAIGVIESELRNGEALLEPIDSTTSIPFQSRRGVQTAGASASADVDGGLLPARKIRRLN